MAGTDAVTKRAVVRHKGQVTIPRQVREALHIEDGDDVAFTIQPDGRVILEGRKSIPADQAWFWTEDWQAGEREASAQLARDEGTKYDTLEEFLDDLD